MSYQVQPNQRRIGAEVFQTMGPFSPAGKLKLAVLWMVVLFGLYAYILQLSKGLEVTAMRDYVSWGMYMSNFVFFIGISHAGTLISAILRVTNTEWRRPITRMAEAITIFALMVGGTYVLIDMGRPDRILNVLFYGRFQSPILWDVVSVTTYLTGSSLYLYVAMIPDLALMVESEGPHARTGWRRKLYRTLTLGYTGTPKQRKLLNTALAIMAVTIIPVAVSVHTVISWVFSMTLRPGWHSTIFGPYFVVGAIYSGTAAIIFAMAVFRKTYHLEKYLTVRHFRSLGHLLLALALIYIYFTFAEYLTSWYGGEEIHEQLIQLVMGHGKYAPLFWATIIIGMFIPTAMLVIPCKKNISMIVTASLLVNIGMWAKRYIIIVPTMETPYIAAQAAGEKISYFPSWVEWAITAAGLAMFILLYSMFSKVFPILDISEIAEPLDEELELQRADQQAPPLVPAPSVEALS